MKRETKNRIIETSYTIYSIGHTIFNILWTFWIIDTKILWWLWWTPMPVFLVIFAVNQEVNTKKRDTPEKLLSCIRTVSCGLAPLVHSPRF